MHAIQKNNFIRAALLLICFTACDSSGTRDITGTELSPTPHLSPPDLSQTNSSQPKPMTSQRRIEPNTGITVKQKKRLSKQPEAIKPTIDAGSLTAVSSTAGSLTKETPPIEVSIIGEHRCLLSELPSRLPDFEFKCRIYKNKRGLLWLSAMDARQTRLSITKKNAHLYSFSGIIYIPERKKPPKHMQRWVEISGQLVRNPSSRQFICKKAKGEVHGYGGDMQARSIDRKTGKRKHTGTRSKVRFEIFPSSDIL